MEAYQPTSCPRLVGEAERAERGVAKVGWEGRGEDAAHVAPAAMAGRLGW